MRFATDWLKSKTTWAAAGALCYAMADVAAKGELTWQSALVALVGLLGATIRDTMARGHEETKLSAELFSRTLETSAAAARATSGMAEQMASLMAAATPKDTKATEPDGEADRTEPTL